jgi:hypothetical protein
VQKISLISLEILSDIKQMGYGIFEIYMEIPMKMPAK